VLKCFIPKQAFKTNTKYCSIIPESKDPRDEWLDVTIQIPIYRESLVQTLMPTLRSCVTARMEYEKETKYSAHCNIVVCDDGMMVMLRDNFAAAEMLWQQIVTTHGRVLKLSKLLATVPRASRSHLKGLRSRDVYEVFHRMLYYYHYDIGFVARSTLDRRGKFKKASNLNSHLRLALGAQQRVQEHPEDLSYEDAMLQEVHNEDGSRFAMFGNDVRIGHLLCVTDADTRMANSVIAKTVPEFLNDKTLGFTQHATKTLSEQRTESYFTKMLSYYNDTLYQGHHLLSSILGCHPPLVGRSVFLRREAIQQCGRVRTLRKAQQWLKSIGLNFVPVDQVGFANLQAQNRTEYWSESNVSYDFELMIHLYSLGFNGRYVNYEDCEFQEGITRSFNEEAVRCRKFALGAHELVFHPFQDMLGRGIFTPVFRTFMTCEIPSYFKIFLTAHLCSYASGGAYIFIFVVSSILQMFEKKTEVDTISVFNPAGIIIISFILYYAIGYVCFIIAMLRMNAINKKLYFQEYRKKWFNGCCIIYTQLRYSFLFQFLFYNVATFTFYFMGSMDHMLARPTTIGSTDKDFMKISRAKALCDTISLNLGSWVVAFIMLLLAYATVLQSFEWDASITPDSKREYLQHSLFAAPAAFLALLAFVVPIILNPYILGWPFFRQKLGVIPVTKSPAPLKSPTERTLSLISSKANDDNGLNDATAEESDDRFLTKGEIDLETGSLTTNDLRLTFTQSPERLHQRKSSNPEFSNANNGPLKTTERLPSVLESRAESGARRRLQLDQNLERVETARLPLDGVLRRTAPLKGPSRDGRYNSPPSRRPGNGTKSPLPTPPHSPNGRRNVNSISPGRRRQPSTIKAVKSDEWGFPVSLNTTY
jgi:Glycosyl transferase family group 2